MRRANGTGTIVKLSGQRRRPYAVRISSRDRYGSLRQYALSYHASLSEAQAALDAYNAQRASGLSPVPNMLTVTLQEVFDGWSARAYRRLKPASITSHNAAWRGRLSRFAACKMREITLDMWQSILDEDEDEGRSQSLINNDAILIRALCAYAMQRDIIAKDYSQFLEVPTVSAKSPRGALTDAQVEQLSSMAERGVPWADTALILCYTGFRISELLSLTPASYHPEEGGYLQGGVKTRSGIGRRVPVHPRILPYLTARLVQHGETIICGSDGRPVLQSHYRTAIFAPLMDKIGAPGATPHWCRHTFATRLHAAGADPLTVKWLMGHSTDSDITSHYTHATMAALSAAIALLS